MLLVSKAFGLVTESVLAERCTWTQEGPWITTQGLSEMIARDNMETNPNTIKPEISSSVAESFFRGPLPCYSPPRHPFPIKSFTLSAEKKKKRSHAFGMVRFRWGHEGGAAQDGIIAFTSRNIRSSFLCFVRMQQGGSHLFMYLFYSRSLLVIYFKYSSVCMFIPNS